MKRIYIRRTDEEEFEFPEGFDFIRLFPEDLEVQKIDGRGHAKVLSIDDSDEVNAAFRMAFFGGNATIIIGGEILVLFDYVEDDEEAAEDMETASLRDNIDKVYDAHEEELLEFMVNAIEDACDVDVDWSEAY